MEKVTAMNKRGMKRQLMGVVISDKMDKTVVVQVERFVKHGAYHKFLRRRARFAAHDADNACKQGDRVLITESRPLSKTKKWRVSKIVEKAV
jgi:small subunit ribosomal protein S17